MKDDKFDLCLHHTNLESLSIGRWKLFKMKIRLSGPPVLKAPLFLLVNTFCVFNTQGSTVKLRGKVSRQNLKARSNIAPCKKKLVRFGMPYLTTKNIVHTSTMYYQEYCSLVSVVRLFGFVAQL